MKVIVGELCSYPIRLEYRHPFHAGQWMSRGVVHTCHICSPQNWEIDTKQGLLPSCCELTIYLRGESFTALDAVGELSILD